MIGKILGEEHPGAADLGTWNRAGLRLPTKFFGVAAQECCRLFQAEGFHTGAQVAFLP